MSRSHDRTHFFKYTTASTALKVLASRKMRWSAPSLFNDPFDHQATYQFPFGEEEFVDQMVAAQERIVFGEREPELRANKALGVASILLRRTLGGRDKNDVLLKFRQAATESAKNFAKHKEAVNGLLTEHLRHSRVLCVTETHDNVVMWSHYAEHHKGVVLRLECVDEVDDNLLIARPVSYVDQFPSFATAEQWVRDLMGEELIDYGSLFFEAAYLKHVDWAYEREWRVRVPLMPHEPEGDGTSLYSKDSRVFSALYLGCRISSTDRDQLLSLTTTRYPEMRVYQAKMSKVTFNLEFEVVRDGV